MLFAGGSSWNRGVYWELVEKTNLKKIVTANPLDSAKKSITKFYQDFKKIKEREEKKREKKIEIEKRNIIKEEKRLIQKQKIQKAKDEKRKIFDFIDDLIQKTGKIGEYDQKI